MIQVECIRKFYDGKKLIGYRLRDANNFEKNIKTKALKQAILNKEMDVVNLKLTSDGRLVSIKNKTLGEKPKTRKLVAVKAVDKNVNILDKLCKKYGFELDNELNKKNDYNKLATKKKDLGWCYMTLWFMPYYDKFQIVIERHNSIPKIIQSDLFSTLIDFNIKPKDTKTLNSIDEQIRIMVELRDEIANMKAFDNDIVGYVDTVLFKETDISKNFTFPARSYYDTMYAIFVSADRLDTLANYIIFKIKRLSTDNIKELKTRFDMYTRINQTNNLISNGLKRFALNTFMSLAWCGKLVKTTDPEYTVFEHDNTGYKIIEALGIEIKAFGIISDILNHRKIT